MDIFFFTLLPVFSLAALFLAMKDRLKSGAGLALVLFLLSLAVVYKIEISSGGARYALLIFGTGLFSSLFLGVGVFPVLLKRETVRAQENFREQEKAIQDGLSKEKLECHKWSEIRTKLLEGLGRITERYEFARTLVEYIEEKPVLAEIATVYAEQKFIKSLAFSTVLEGGAGGKDGGEWDPVFVSGWVTEADWKKILRQAQFDMNSPGQCSVTLGSQESMPSRKGPFVLVHVPVKWGGQVHGLLTFLSEGELPKDFMEETLIYAQLLGLGLHKAALYRMMTERSRRDGLTNLYLRRIFMERLNEEITFSKRYKTSFSVLMVDIDHFKNVNDKYGHPAGDVVLKAVADCLRKAFHPGVMICRYGGEEFAILIGLASMQEVAQNAELLRASMEGLVVTARDDSSKSKEVKISVTVSVGVAHYLPDAPVADELIRRSDVALYRAKEAGRNCVKIWEA